MSTPTKQNPTLWGPPNSVDRLHIASDAQEARSADLEQAFASACRDKITWFRVQGLGGLFSRLWAPFGSR